MKKVIMILTLTLLLATTMFAQGMHGKDCDGSECGDRKSGMMKHKGHMNKQGMRHDKMNKMKKGMHSEGWMKVLKKLDLTESQEKEIKDTLEDNKKKSITAKAAIEILEMDMHKYMKAHNFKEAMKISDQLSDARGDLHKNKIKMMEKIYNKLTDEQKENLKKIKEECGEAPMKMGKNCK